MHQFILPSLGFLFRKLPFEKLLKISVAPTKFFKMTLQSYFLNEMKLVVYDD